MKKYHKIRTVYNRDPETEFKTLLIGEWALPEFEYLALNKWVFTEKVDGTNIRIKCQAYQENGMAYGITFGGKTDNAQIPAFLVSQLENMFHNEQSRQTIADIFKNGACLYGEGYGAKIQKGGGNYRQDQSFVLFDVKVGEWWLQRKDVVDIADRLHIDVVPIIGTGTLPQMVKMAEEGFSSQWGNFMAEGIVGRPDIELKSRNSSRIITKIKHKDFANVRVR